MSKFAQGFSFPSRVFSSKSLLGGNESGNSKGESVTVLLLVSSSSSSTKPLSGVAHNEEHNEEE